MGVEMDSNPTLCFTCGQGADCGTRLNRLDDGRVCPTCAERLMEGLPSLLPGSTPAEQPELAAEELAEEAAQDLEEA